MRGPEDWLGALSGQSLRKRFAFSLPKTEVQSTSAMDWGK